MRASPHLTQFHLHFSHNQVKQSLFLIRLSLGNVQILWISLWEVMQFTAHLFLISFFLSEQVMPCHIHCLTSRRSWSWSSKVSLLNSPLYLQKCQRTRTWSCTGWPPSGDSPKCSYWSNQRGGQRVRNQGVWGGGGACTQASQAAH